MPPADGIGMSLTIAREPTSVVKVPPLPPTMGALPVPSGPGVKSTSVELKATVPVMFSSPVTTLASDDELTAISAAVNAAQRNVPYMTEAPAGGFCILGAMHASVKGHRHRTLLRCLAATCRCACH